MSQNTLFSISSKIHTKQQFLVRLLLEFIQEKQLVKHMNQFCSESKASPYFPFALLFVQKVTKFRKLREDCDSNIHKCLHMFQNLKTKFFESSADELSKYLPSRSTELQEAKTALQESVQKISERVEAILYPETSKKHQQQQGQQSDDEQSEHSQEGVITPQETDERLLQVLPNSVFDKLYVPLVNDLAISLLPPLIKSKFFSDFYDKNVQTIPILKKTFLPYLMTLNFADPLNDMAFLAETRIRDHHLVKEDDVILLQTIANTPLGKEEEEQKGPVHISQSNYAMELYGNSGAKIIKAKGTVPFSMQQVLDAILSSQFRTLYDNNFMQQTVLEKYERSKSQYFETVISVETYPFAWPIHNRDFVTANSVIIDEQNGFCFVVSKPAEHIKAPQKKGTTRGLHFGGFVLKKISETETSYSYICCTDFKCQTHNSEAFMNKFVTKRAKNFHSALLNYLQQINSINIGNSSSMELLKSTGKQNRISSMKTTPTAHVTINNVKRCDSIILPSTKIASFDETTVVMPTTLKRLHYYSLFKKKMTEQELSAIEQIAKELNSQRHITGMLLYTADKRLVKNCKGIFYQIIEGEASVIDALYAKLQSDKRHHGVRMISEEHNLREMDRQYPVWSMECFNLDRSNHFFNVYLRELIRDIDRSLRPNDTGCCTIA